MKYLINVLASLSVVLNTLTGGSYRNTFSARCGYLAYVKHTQTGVILVKTIDTLIWFDTDHCYKEYLNEKDSFLTK